MESNQISKSYQTPQTSQSNTLIKNCKTQEEANLIYAIEKKSALKYIDADNINQLIDLIGKWRWMLGVNNSESEVEIAKELALISQFLIKNYSFLTLDEISLAIDLSLLNKLDCDVRTFNAFSPMYVSRVLNAYGEYRKQLYKEVMDRKHREDEIKEMEKKVSPEDKMQSMIELIEYFYNEFKSIGIINDHFNTLYNYFRRAKKINPDKQMIDNAMEYGKVKSETYISNYFNDALNSEKPEKDNIIKRFARNYCVETYFNENTLEDIIKKVNIKEFTDV